MSSINIFPKAVTVLLIASIFFTACDVPDISKFTEQSAEMTRGIRQGVKDTGNLLETAATNEDLFLPETRIAFSKHSKNYNAAMKPTLETLDALDDYLEALNALAQANKKSAEDSKALVGAVNNLVSAASKLVIVPPAAGLDIPEAAINIGTGVLAVANQFRTAKNFKDRVNAAAEIVEGRYEKVTEKLPANGKTETVVEFKKICTDEKKTEIENVGKQLTEARKKIIEQIDNDPRYKNLSKKSKDIIKEKSLKTEFKAQLEKAEQDAAAKVRQHGCGVIDLLKFTIQDLKRINKQITDLMLTNFRRNNMVTVDLSNSIDDNNFRIQREASLILKHESLISQIKRKEYEYSLKRNAETKNELRDEILQKIEQVRDNLNGIFMLDGKVNKDLIDVVKECSPPKSRRCMNMKKFIGYTDETTEVVETESESEFIYTSVPANDFDRLNDHIESILERRVNELFNQNEVYLSEKERIKPDYDRINSEYSQMKVNQQKLDKLFSASIGALNTWTITHANLRVTVNTKKPLSVASLTAKVKEIWAIIDPKTE